MPIGEYGNMNYNQPYSDDQWLEVKMHWRHRRVWGIKVANLVDDASITREPLCRLTAWITRRDLWPTVLPVMAVLVFCCIVMTAGYVVLS